MYKVYKITNNINGNSYVGYTKQELEKRLSQHFSLSKKSGAMILCDAIRKHGKEYFTIELLETYNTREEASQGEIVWIAKLKPVYNIHEGGVGGAMYGPMNGMYGKKHTDKTKRLMSEQRTGEKNGMYGKTHTPAVKKILSEALKARGPWNKGKKIGPNLALRGKPKSEETRKKMSEAKKQYYANRNRI